MATICTDQPILHFFLISYLSENRFGSARSVSVFYVKSFYNAINMGLKIMMFCLCN